MRASPRLSSSCCQGEKQKIFCVYLKMKIDARASVRIPGLESLDKGASEDKRRWKRRLRGEGKGNSYHKQELWRVMLAIKKVKEGEDMISIKILSVKSK